jgi:hypothetical protein
VDPGPSLDSGLAEHVRHGERASERSNVDVREKSLNAMRQLIDEIDGGRFPGL